MLDPQARALIDLMIENKIPPAHTLPPAELRTVYRERSGLTQPEPPACNVREFTLPGPTGALGARLYRHTSAPERLPLLVYFHGGGWTIGDLDTHDVPCRQLAVRSGSAVLAVDYRLGPEHRFPAAVDDCLASVRWARQNAPFLAIDPSRIAVGGDSAGGNLAAVVAIAERDAGTPLAFQLLIYPATDMRAVAPSHQANAQGYLLTADSIAYYRSHYIPDPALWTDWRASPLLAPDHARLPPALVITAGYDPLRDEGRQYADALSAAGNGVQYVCFERQVHGFFAMTKAIEEGDSAVSLAAYRLARVFSQLRA
jgi:acetyl esterase